MNNTKCIEHYMKFGEFNWIEYTNERPELKNKFQNKEELYKYLIEEEIKINPFIYFEIDKKDILPYSNLYTYNGLNISYENFQWKSYLFINYNLKNSINDREYAWKHWVNHGKKQEFAFSLINNSNIHCGRLGNLFFINMFLHFMSIKYNLKCSYKQSVSFNLLGINFHKGENIYTKNLLVTERNFLPIMNDISHEPSNLIMNNIHCQSKKFCLILKEYFYTDENKNIIMNNNIFKNRYNKNNDLFIHVRLGDIANRLPNIDKYYEEALDREKGQYDRAYISSDSIEHEICVKLIKKYKLIVLQYNEIETIMFANTCKKLILSGGTFSWMLGFFTFFTNTIYYPELLKNKTKKWYGDIFSFSNWIGISYKN